MKTHLLTIFCAAGVKFILATQTCEGARLRAASPSYVDVAAAVNAANPGDTVLVPAGTASWTATLDVDKPITLQGAGVGATVIMNVQGDGSQPSTYDYLTMNVSASSTSRTRITGFTFDGNRQANGLYLRGGQGQEIQIDACDFREFWGRGILMGGLPSVLIHGCRFTDCFKMIDTYAGGSSMNVSWQEPLTLGTVQCVVIEDCTFLYESWYPRSAGASASHGLGGRATWRHNTWINRLSGLNFYPILDAHGNQQPVAEDNTGAHRGTRQLEVYNNTFINDAGSSSSARLMDMRGGTIVVHGNTYSGSGFSGSYYMREEDGPDRYNHLQSYPGYDQHWIYIWNNTRNGEAMNNYSFAYSHDPTFIVLGLNLFQAPMPGYSPLSYPHPWRAEQVQPARNPQFTE